MNRKEQLKEKWAKIEKNRCSCGVLYCNKDHSICIRCGQKNNLDAIPNKCGLPGEKKTKHAYSF